MNPLSFYFLLVLLVLPQTVSADDCAIVEENVDSLFEFYKNKCPGKKGQDLCVCLKEQSKDNVLLAQQFATRTDLEDLKKKFVADQTKRLLNVYKQMTYGSEYQKKMLNLEATPTVGCPAEDLRTFYQAGVKEFTLSKLNDQKAKQEEDLVKCGNSLTCNELNKKLKATNLEIENVDKIVGNACGRLTNVINDLTTLVLDVPAVQDLLKARIWYVENQPMESKKIQAIDDAIEKIRSTPAQPANYVASSTCLIHEASPLYDSIILSYQADLKKNISDISNYAKVVATQNVDSTPPETDLSEKLVGSIEAFNTKVKDEFKKKFDHVGSNSCYTFSEYKIWKSRPSEALLNALISSDNPSHFFQPSGDFTNKVEVEKINYLKANPAIANTLPVTCAGPQFGLAMQQFASKVKGMSDVQKMQEYIQFMKKDGAQLLGEREVLAGQRINCERLGRNMAAVFMTDEPAPVPVYNTSNAFQMLSQQILVCKTSSAMSSASTNLAYTLNANPLYLVQSEIPNNQSEEDPDSDNDYQAFLKEHCGEFSAFREKIIKECSNPTDLESCSAASEDATKTADLRAKYFSEFSKQKHVMGAVVGENIVDGINATLTSEQHNTVATVNSLKNQDSVVRKHFDKNIKPFLKTPVLASRGREAEYKQAVANDRDVVSKAAKIPYVPALTTPSVASTTPTPVVVAEPDWTKPVLPEVTSAALATAEPKNFMPPSYPDQTPEQKLETIKEVRANVLAEGEKIVAATEDPIEKQKIINDLKSSISKFDKEADKVQTTVQSAPPVTQTNSNVVSGLSNPINNAQSSGGYSGSGPAIITPSGVAGSYSKRVQTAADKSSAALLKSKYADSEKLANRGPASIADETAKIVLGPSMTGIIAPDATIMSHIQMDAAKFKDGSFILSRVQTELANKNVKKDGNVLIQFFDKTKNEVLVVNVIWQNNQWVISQVPRKSMLSNLNLTLISQTNK